MTTLEGLKEAQGLAAESVWLYFLEITHDDLTTPLRLVRNSVDVTRAGLTAPFAAEVFTAIDFDMTVPKHDGGASSPTGSLQVPNVDRKITDELRKLIGKKPAKLVTVVARSTAINIDEYGPIRLKLISVEWDVQLVKGVLGIGDLMIQEFPEGTFNNADFPAILPG